MRIALFTIGGRGDTQPFVALAIRLKQEGHRVTLASLRSRRRVGISARQHLRQPMDLPNGPVPPLLMAFLVLRSHSNQMRRCVVLPIIPSILKSGAPNAMAPCGCCMPRALAIAAPVLCVPSVKRAVRRSSRDG